LPPRHGRQRAHGQVTITVDSRKKKGSQEEPLDWTYGVVAKVNSLEKRLTLRLSSYRIQTPRKVSVGEKWIAMLVAVIANVLRHLNLEHAERLKLYVCQDLSCSLLRKRAVLTHAIAETLKIPPLAISVEFVTKNESKSKRTIAEQYKRAHLTANREKVDVWCDPQEVERILSLVHRAWLGR
jgi:hypothetical protein